MHSGIRHFLGAIATMALLAFNGPAQSARYIGAFDPLYGAPFDTATNALAWSGEAQFDLVGCGSTGLVYAGSGCTMSVSNAYVKLDGVDTTTAEPYLINETQTLNFAGSMSISSAYFSGGNLIWVASTGIFSPLQATLGAAGRGLYEFALGFEAGVDAQVGGVGGARLYHRKLGGYPAHPNSGHDDTEFFWQGIGAGHWIEDCKTYAIGDPYCGYSATDPIVNFRLVAEVPEPQTYALVFFGIALIGMSSAYARRRRGAN